MNKVDSLPITIQISPLLLDEILADQAIEDGRVGNYIRIEDRVNCMRYTISDKIMTLVFSEIQKLQGIKSKVY